VLPSLFFFLTDPPLCAFFSLTRVLSVTLNGTSWESFLHDVWRSDEEDEEDTGEVQAASDDEDDGEDEDEDDEDEVHEIERKQAAALRAAARNGRRPSLVSLTPWSAMVAPSRTDGGAAVRSPLLAAVNTSPLASTLVDFTLYPTMDEYFALDAAAAPTAPSTMSYHPTATTGTVGTAAQQTPAEDHRNDEQEKEEETSATRRSHRVARSLLEPATVDVRVLVSLAPLAEPAALRGSHVPVDDPAGELTPARRKKMRLEDQLSRALAMGLPGSAPGAAMQAARLVRATTLIGEDDDDDGDDSDNDDNLAEAEDDVAAAALLRAMPTAVLCRRLAALPQAQLLTLHGLVHGRPAPTPAAGRKRAARRKTATWSASKKRRGTPKPSPSVSMTHAQDECSGEAGERHSHAHDDENNEDAEEEDDDIDVVGL
jgi:hypothetical protein